MQHNDTKLKQIISNIFEIELSTINNETSVDTVERWDSLNHMKLVLGLEGTFDVTLSEEQSVEVISYPIIKEVLKEHGVHF